MTSLLYHGMWRCTIWFSVIHCEELSSPEQIEHTSTSSSSAKRNRSEGKKRWTVSHTDIHSHILQRKKKERRLQEKEKREEMVKWMRHRQHKQDISEWPPREEERGQVHSSHDWKQLRLHTHCSMKTRVRGGSFPILTQHKGSKRGFSAKFGALKVNPKDTETRKKSNWPHCFYVNWVYIKYFAFIMHMIITENHFCNVVHKPLHNATFGANVIDMKYDHR